MGLGKGLSHLDFQQIASFRKEFIGEGDDLSTESDGGYLYCIAYGCSAHVERTGV
jgi:hypothetical protein